MSAEFQALLRTLRDRHNWSLETLAKAADLDHALISRLERGIRQPTRENLPKLVAGLALGEQDADALWLASGFVPPDVGQAELRAALALVRTATLEEIATAGRLIAVARGTPTAAGDGAG